MNLVPLLAKLVLPARPGRPGGRPGPAVRPGRRTARRAVGWFIAAAVGLQAGAFLAIDVVWPGLRDPEYARRVGRLRERIAENPGRPVVLVVGSSRASMGLRPEAWEESRPARADHPDPLLFNMSLVGSGPMMELMCLRRVYADGLRPDAVVLEYWPPFLREDGPYFEPDRIDHARLSDRDRPLVREYFARPAETERLMLRDRFHPLYETRHRLMAQTLPRWQPWDKRMEMAWGMLDEWGWLAGLEEKYPPDPKARGVRLAHCGKIYRDQFQGYTIHPLAKRALRESVALARANGTKVAFAYLPEATEFRSWMPPAVEQAAQGYLATLCRELDIPLIDARLWMEDGYLVDGFHLSRQGAAEFTRKFGPAVAATFPDLRRGP
ncbi:MAG: hypothetical protein JWO38_8070 [Gemmataceae bacterium]|nr:hypothetical protein [Gemmataceae bacterium]